MSKTPSARRWRFPSSYWFPLAAAYSAIVLPWSVLGQLGLLPTVPGIADNIGHAHEMLFGFALAAVAGYTLPAGKKAIPLGLLAVWAAARLSWLGWPQSWAAAAFNTLFIAGVAWQVAPVYLRASKWRNRAVAFILIALTAAVLAFHATGLLALGSTQHGPALFAVVVLSALMYFMSGRILAPAIAGHVRRKAPKLQHVVQAGPEGAVLILLAPAAIFINASHGQALASLCLVGAAAVALFRMLRWRIWHCWDKPDLLAVLAGHGWLIIGWLLLAAARQSASPATLALHAITIGALGSLTWSVMLRTQLFRSGQSSDALGWSRLCVAIISAACVVRIAAGLSARAVPLLMCSALLWSACYFLLFLLLMRISRLRV